MTEIVLTHETRVGRRKRTSEWSPLVSLRDVSRMTAMHERTLHRRSHQPGFPRSPVKCGGKPLFLLDEVLAYIRRIDGEQMARRREAQPTNEGA